MTKTLGDIGKARVLCSGPHGHFITDLDSIPATRHPHYDTCPMCPKCREEGQQNMLTIINPTIPLSMLTVEDLQIATGH